jgi:death-on-curing protein
MISLNIEQVKFLHKIIIQESGGSHGVKDISLVESAINRHKATFDGNDLYPDIISKISVTTVSLVKNHGFVDGNKRIGIAVMDTLLRLNFITVKFTQRELIDLGLGLASGKLNEEDVENWIRDKVQ